MGRLELLNEKIEIAMPDDEIKLFETFVEKINEKTFNFILNNFEFIGSHKSGCIPIDKKALTFTYGNKRFYESAIIPIKLKDYSFYNDLYIPDNYSKVIMKYDNIYGIVALADINGNLYCNDIYHYCYENDDNGHLLFEDLIRKYKEFDFPITYLADTLLQTRLDDFKDITKDIKIDVKIVKTKIDKKAVMKMLRPEIIAMETAIKTYYKALTIEKDAEIEKLKKTIESNNTKAFSNSMRIISSLFKIGAGVKFKNDRLLIDCSDIKVTKLKANDIVYDLPEDCQVFKIGVIALPFVALSLKDCYAVKDSSFHPNVDKAPCFGDAYYKIEEIADAIKQLQTINLDSAFPNYAKEEAWKLYHKLKNQAPSAEIWTAQ